MTTSESHTRVHDFTPKYQDMPASKGQTEAVWQAIMPNTVGMRQDDVNVVLSVEVRVTRGGGYYAYLHGSTADRKSINGRGVASANSGGYHKESHSVFHAMTDAGVRFDGYWDGMGEMAIQHAMVNMAHAMGYAGARVQRVWVG